ncbi:hypothetical protein Nepgr_028300 [Nepenthes gracilis]|uniref:Glycosyltransferase n=1 Tax=Nepenthes gracilis TaxID=150966 RepID=A0AAD3Y1Z7_NEPGR|nr:hypothetical protein Nepgr_028300 [Nepenthes gracilis]
MTSLQSHFLLVTHPLQSHINPAFQLAERLLRAGAVVTLAATVSAYRRMVKGALPRGLTIATFSDGYDDGFTKLNGGSDDDYMTKFKQCGTKTLHELIDKRAREGSPVTCVVYTVLLSWVPAVARRFNVPSALLWIQPAALFDIYYYFLTGHCDVTENCGNDPSWSLELPGLPLKLKCCDLPSCLAPSNPHEFFLRAMEEQFEELERETNARILVNTFEALEADALKSIQKFRLVAVGPLLPSAFLLGGDPSDNSFGVDLFQRPSGCLEWLDTKSESSVIYVSFGSISVLSRRQMEEMARALLNSGQPFIWVVRANENICEDEEEKLSCMEELERRGLIVPWCSQLEVLSHPAVGCFVTHGGWNSSMESLAAGVPMVVFPQWSDQTTNAKLIEDLWKTGVKVDVTKEGIVESQELERCLEMAMESDEMRRNAKKWKELAVEASKDGGPSERNLRDFVMEVGFSIEGGTL